MYYPMIYAIYQEVTLMNNFQTICFLQEIFVYLTTKGMESVTVLDL